MLEQLSTFNKVSVVVWVLGILYFAPKVYMAWRGRRQDWIDAAWLVGALLMVVTTLARPDWTSLSAYVFTTLLVLSLLERRTRR